MKNIQHVEKPLTFKKHLKHIKSIYPIQNIQPFKTFSLRKSVKCFKP